MVYTTAIGDSAGADISQTNVEVSAALQQADDGRVIGDEEGASDDRASEASQTSHELDVEAVEPTECTKCQEAEQMLPKRAGELKLKHDADTLTACESEAEILTSGVPDDGAPQGAADEFDGWIPWPDDEPRHKCTDDCVVS